MAEEKLYWCRRIDMGEVEGEYRPLLGGAEPLTLSQVTERDRILRRATGSTSCYVVCLSRMPLSPAPPAPHDEQPGVTRSLPPARAPSREPART